MARLLLREDEDLIRPVPEIWRSFRSWWPLAAAMVVALTVVAMLPRLANQEPQTPLALTVELQPEGWLVSWNPRATAIRMARRARLYVVSGNSNRRIELGPTELASGVFRHFHTLEDNTFRLEIEERTGRLAAESFRVVRR